MIMRKLILTLKRRKEYRHWFASVSVSVLMGSILMLSGCTAATDNAKDTEKALVEEATESVSFEAAELEAISRVSDRVNVWSAYWDCDDDLDTLRKMSDSYSSICLFEAYYIEDELTIPEQSVHMLGELRRKKHTKDKDIYLTVVNDYVNGNKTEHKSTELLGRLIGDEEQAKLHAREIVTLAVRNGFDGIELDYENIRSDLELWNSFLQFEDYLLSETKAAGLKLRILLETQTPMKELSGRFPDEAQYVVMCYNLCGSGTTKGPKADSEFLKDIYDSFKGLPNVEYALANGGFEWIDEAGGQAIKRPEAEMLLDKYGAVPIRDKESQALYFEFTENNKKHTIWYADEATLEFWTETLKNLSGNDVAVGLWRL